MNSRPVTANDPPIIEADSDEDAEAVFDRVCRRELGMSGPEFLTQWDAGEFSGLDVDAVPGLAEVVAVLPFVR